MSEHKLSQDLVLVGNVAPRAVADTTHDHTPGLSWNAKVLTTGYVAYAELPALYSRATALVYHSLQETFGIPVLEAMAAGVPVIISDIPALREIAGEAALIVEPNNVDQLAEAMGVMTSRPEIAGELVRKGLERVREFTWERAARQTLEVYKKVGRR
jgi:glycosyltransferase involved in cell wall biosynthesis